MANPPDSPEGYTAIDGSWVAIPPPPDLPFDPLPVFGPEDYGWLDALIASRKRSLEHDLPKLTLPDLPSGLSEDERAEIIALQESGRPIREAQHREDIERQRKAIAAADLAFGVDGRGFLAALNDGSIFRDFWGAIDHFYGTRMGLVDVQAPPEHKIIVDILKRLPEGLQVHVLAQNRFLWPTLKPRKSMPFEMMYAAWINGPTADFRLIETGPAKPARGEDVPVELRRMMASSFGQVQAGYLAIKGNIVNVGESEEMIDSKSRRSAELIKGAAPVASDFVGVGRLSIGESNMFKQGAYREAMAQIGIGRPEGHYLRSAVQKIGSGFLTTRLADFPRRAVWPYIATHLDIIDRALGLAAPFSFDPKFERSKAIDLLLLLPKIPARYHEVLKTAAQSRTRGEAESARRALGETKSVPMATGSGLNASDVLAKTETERIKPFKRDTEWLSAIALPSMLLFDCRPAPERVLRSIIRAAVDSGSPAGSPDVMERMSVLSPQSQAEFGLWALDVWIAHDTQPHPPELLLKWEEETKASSYRLFCMNREIQQLRGENPPFLYFEDWVVSHRADWAKDLQQHLNWNPYSFSAQPARGLLALALAADPNAVCLHIKDYLGAHGRRTNHAKSLLDLAAHLPDRAGMALVRELAANLPQKSLRAHAAALLGAAR